MFNLSYRALTLVVLVALAVIGTSAKAWRVGSELLNDRFGSHFKDQSLSYGSYEARQAINELISTYDIDSVEINVAQGNVTVSQQSGSNIVIEGLASGSKEYIDGLQLKSEKQGTTAVYTAGYEKTNVTGQRYRGRTDIRVMVPEGISVTVNNDAGEVNVTGIREDVNVSIKMGTIRVADIRGNLDASASAGTIEVESAEITDHVKLSNSLGEVKFDGTLGKTNAFSTSAGTVDISVPADTCVSIHASVAAGEINSTLPVSEMSVDEPRASASGQLGTGTPTGSLTIDVSVGEISISSR